jgi:hypothetical protein
VVTEVAATLLEREHELRVVDRVLTEAAQSRGHVLVVEAAAGLGKTSLLPRAQQPAWPVFCVFGRVRPNSSATSPTSRCAGPSASPVLRAQDDMQAGIDGDPLHYGPPLG